MDLSKGLILRTGALYMPRPSPRFDVKKYQRQEGPLGRKFDLILKARFLKKSDGA